MTRLSALPAVIFPIVALLTVAGCPGTTCPTEMHTDAARAIRMHRSLHRAVRGLRAEARVDQRGPKKRVRGTVLMMMERPDRLRLDAMTRFGPAAILTADGEEFAFADLREKRFLSGRTCPANIGRMLGIEFSPEDVGRLLIGQTPLIPAQSEHIECRGGGYMIRRTSPTGERQEITFDIRPEDRKRPVAQQHLRLRRSEVFGTDGKSIWNVEFDSYSVVTERNARQSSLPQGVALPMRVRLIDRRNGADTIIRFKRIELNVDAPKQAFSQTAPPGSRAERVDCRR